MEAHMINGVEVTELKRKATAMKKNPPLAHFEFRARNKWVDAGHSRTTITAFHGAGEDVRHDKKFKIEADEPHVLLGGDKGTNPVEHLLNALVSCLTGSMVYHAATRGIKIDSIESTVEGDMDIRGFLGLADDIRTGYQDIRVQFKVRSDASEDELKQCAMFSPVLDSLTGMTRVSVDVSKR